MDALTPQRWLRVNELFDAALRLEAGRRTDFLNIQCGSDLALRDEVLSLLEFDRPAGAFLSSPTRTQTAIPSGATGGLGRRPTPTGGATAGAYRLIREIGAGGMGAVWLAERGDGEFRKQVAVKLIRRGMDSNEVLRRFRHERQLLAGLVHPNICRLIDGGAAPDGRPFLVMDLVAGQPLDDYCDRRRLTIRQRVELFIQVADAVQFAHQNLVVHRDLKPSNILVSDGGVPTLLDFGIAKVLSPTDPDRGRTQTANSNFLTPEYASPEQVRGDPISTASDVYSLGVVLYRILSGRPPYRLDGLGLPELARVVCEEMPPRPSRAVVEPPPARAAPPGGAAPADIARARGCDVARLCRQLSGDLDTIVLRALAKDAARRYASVDQLAADLHRYLAGRPVSARPDSLRYRAVKFVARNRLEVGAIAASLALVVVVAGLAFVRVREERDQALRARSQEAAARQAAATAAQTAVAKADVAAEVMQFLLTMLASADPNKSPRRDLTVRQVVDAAAALLDTPSTRQAEVEATLRGAIGNVYENLGLVDLALVHHRRALALRGKVFGESSPEAGLALHNLALAEQSHGEFRAAIEHFEQAVAICRARAGDDPPDLAVTLSQLAGAYADAGDASAALRCVNEALAIHERCRPPDHADIAFDLGMRGRVLTLTGDARTAEESLRRALKIHRDSGRGDSLALSATLNKLGATLLSVDRYAEAEPLLREALEIDRRVAGPDHPQVASDLGNLGLLLNARGRAAEAERALRESLEIRRKRLGDDHPDTAVSMSNLGNVLLDRGKAAEAEPLCRTAVEVLRKAFGETHPAVASSLNNLAVALDQQGHHAAAEPVYRSAIDTYRRLPGHHSDQIATTLMSLGACLYYDQRLEPAEAAMREALTAFRKLPARSNPRMAACETSLAAILHDRGRHAESEPLLADALRQYESALPADHPEITRVQIDLARCRLTLGHPRDAEPLLRRALATRERLLPPGHWRIANVRTILGECLVQQGQFADAEPLIVPSIKIIDAAEDAPADIRQAARQRAAELYRRWGRPADAQRFESATTLPADKPV